MLPEWLQDDTPVAGALVGLGIIRHRARAPIPNRPQAARCDPVRREVGAHCRGALPGEALVDGWVTLVIGMALHFQAQRRLAP
jgi:hypothetical protein